jgi:type IV secretory pathway VirB2 component (pilin)
MAPHNDAAATIGCLIVGTLALFAAVVFIVAAAIKWIIA